MPIKSCKECGKEVSTTATACPHCGAKQPAKTSVTTWVVGGAMALVVVSALNNANNRAASNAVGSSAQSSNAPAPYSPVPEHVGPKWDYETENDAMAGTPVKFASIKSENLLYFAFPYRGTNQPVLTLRKGTRRTDAYLRIGKGQFLCSLDCRVQVKFDDKAPVSFYAVGPSDHSTTAIFLRPAAKFINSVKSAKTVNIQATFYQEGEQVMKFETDGLKWD